MATASKIRVELTIQEANAVIDALIDKRAKLMDEIKVNAPGSLPATEILVGNLSNVLLALGVR